jgi:hypothetical protein
MLMVMALRLFVTGADGRARSVEVVKFDHVGDLSDIGELGLSLAQARVILSRLQEEIVATQVRLHAERSRACRQCGATCRIKDHRTREIDTLFGRASMVLARFACPACGRLDVGLDWPPRCRSTPELDQTRAHLSALMSYRSAIGVLTAFFPIEAGVTPETFRRHTLRIGKQLASAPVKEAERAPSSITVGIDSTFIRSRNVAEQRHLEVMVGSIESDSGAHRVFAAVSGARPGIEAALNSGLEAVGRVKDSAITAFTDGDPCLRNILSDSGICAKPILDWFHIGMRLQHLKQTAHGLPIRGSSQRCAKALILAEIERLHWRLWNGKAKNARKAIDAIRGCMHAFKGEGHRWAPPPSRRVWSALLEVDRYVSGQSGWVVNYAERHRAGLRVGTALTEGAANYLVNRRMNKSQQMTWSPQGANLLLQVRCAAYNGTLDSPIAAPSTTVEFMMPLAA